MPKTENVACRVNIDELREIDSAADGLGLNRSEWLKVAIARQLGKRPRLSLPARLALAEQKIADLCDKLAEVTGQ